MSERKRPMNANKALWEKDVFTRIEVGFVGSERVECCDGVLYTRGVIERFYHSILGLERSGALPRNGIPKTRDGMQYRVADAE
jgi:hypothetical protein